MAILSSGQDIYLRQGDTGNVSFSGIPTDEEYLVYMSVYDPDNNKILSEITATEFDQETGIALFTIDENTSNSLPIGEWEYGLKICIGGMEDTLLPRSYIDDSGNLVNEQAPKFTVDYKYVEGL